MSSIREMRLHLEYSGGLRRVAKLIFTRQDASLYLVPYASRGTYFYGTRSLGDQQTTDAFDFREQLSVQSNPKLSIHESGQVHIYADGHQRAGPLQIARLSELRGEHLATLQWDSIETLTTFTERPR